MVAFAAPQALLLFLALAATADVVALSLAWKRRATRLMLNPSTSSLAATFRVSFAKQVAKAVLLILGLACLIVAAAQPYLGQKPPDGPSQTADLMMVLDVSLSMAAQDVAPSRLQVGKDQILALLRDLQGERAGLTVFAGDAALRIPVTYDYDAVATAVRAAQVDSVTRPGTSIAEGLRVATLALRQSQASVKAIILVSDGEDFGGSVGEAGQAAANLSIPIYTIGVGTSAGSTIPASGPGGDVKRDTHGEIVQTRLEEGILRSLADAGGGMFMLATPGGRQSLEAHRRLTFERPTPDAGNYRELAPYFAALGLVLMLAEVMLLPAKRGDGTTSAGTRLMRLRRA